MSATQDQRLTGHAKRLTHDRFLAILQEDSIQCRLEAMQSLAPFLLQQMQENAAEILFLRGLACSEKALGADDIWTLGFVVSVGTLDSDQGKVDGAQDMYLRALAGYKKARGKNHPLTLHVSVALGNLYRRRGMLRRSRGNAFRSAG